MSRTSELEYQVNKAGGWPNGFSRGETYDLDKIILEDNKFRIYLDYIADQESALKVSRQNILTVKQGLNKNPMEVAQNAINFLITLLEDQVKV